MGSNLSNTLCYCLNTKPLNPVILSSSLAPSESYQDPPETACFNQKELPTKPSPKEKFIKNNDLKANPLMRVSLKHEEICIMHPNTKKNNTVNLDCFSIVRNLGVGATGKVLLVKRNDNQKLYAMKIIKKKEIFKNGLEEHIKLEKKLLEQHRNKFLVKLKYGFQTPSKIYLVMEYMSGGELSHLLRQFKTFTENLTVFYAAEILLGLEYLHEKMSVIYRDLKPENVLLDSKGHIKLVDFGYSKQTTVKTNTFAGTPEYMAPEVILGVGHSKMVDFWSLGILIFEMLCGKPPFTSFDGNFGKIIKLILENKPSYPIYFTDKAKDLISKLLKNHEKERLGYNGIEEIKSHPFFQKINWKMLASGKLEPPLNIDQNEDDLNNVNGANEKIVETLDSVVGNLSKITYDEGELNMSRDKSMDASFFTKSFKKNR